MTARFNTIVVGGGTAGLATNASRVLNAPGGHASSRSPGRRFIQFGVFRWNPSQRPRQLSPTRPRSRTTCA